MSELVGSIFIGLADIITDGITYARLRSGNIAVPNEGYKVAYTTVLCFGVVTTALSLGYRLRNARLMRADMIKLGQLSRAVSASAARRQAQQCEWELAQTSRAKVIAVLALLAVAVQGKTTPAFRTREAYCIMHRAAAYISVPLNIIRQVVHQAYTVSDAPWSFLHAYTV